VICVRSSDLSFIPHAAMVTLKNRNIRLDMLAISTLKDKDFHSDYTPAAKILDKLIFQVDCETRSPILIAEPLGRGHRRKQNSKEESKYEPPVEGSQGSINGIERQFQAVIYHPDKPGQQELRHGSCLFLERLQKVRHSSMKPTALSNGTEVRLGVWAWPASRLGQVELSL
jgi:hypothetical protein